MSPDRGVRRDAHPAPTQHTATAADGYRLAVRRYEADEPRVRVVVAGATGVPQGFYRRFAMHAAQRGFDVVTFDYRGIGESAPASLRGSDMDYLDWGRLDLAAVVDDTDDGDLPTHLVGHSFGGQALGLLPTRVCGSLPRRWAGACRDA